MYTQCPECGTAFRVTAEVLKRAAGKVRCGGCGSAFNALDFLSEHKPVAPVPPVPADEQAAPAPEPPRLEADEPPLSISAERSAALLKTLDELAGSDIRIEDTGVEWRLLGADEDEDSEDMDDTGSMRWFIDESPTPVDEQLSAEPGEIDAPEIFEPGTAPGRTAEMRFDDDTPLPEDFDFDSEPAESGPGAEIEIREEPVELDTAQADLELGELEDWEDLLGEVAAADQPREVEAPAAADEDQEHEPLPDVDTQFATQAEAMGIDLSGIRAQAAQSEDDADDESTIDDELLAAAFEGEAAAREGAGDRDEIDAADDYADFDELELDMEEPDDLLEPRDRELVVRSDADATLAAELGLGDDDGEIEAWSEVQEDDKPEHVIPPLTEEEQTINRLIDQDLLAIAVEDEDGFTSTIIQKQRQAAVEPPGARDDGEADVDAEAAAEDFEQDNRLVETIIMEGEFVRDAFEEERLEAERRKAADAQAVVEDSKDAAGSDRERKPAAKVPLNYRMAAGIAALALLLGAQYLHQSRESLAVYPAFSASVGSLYRMIGKPVTPAWDITGWRFEATKGSTDDNDAVLTIYSRIGNNSGEALPYPLINVSLTDRFEDIIGSKVLEPGEYLAASLDTRKPVPPGETFSALISIDAPDAGATGFKLNVCYRQPGGRLRCAIDDFR
ncbi:MAG TPA: DUF3426 domain-containing protein [Woeseiaceae bacterium]|nr:DUF3426 domain-containing protein [Woeseiaceae bacterium]